MLQPGAEPDGPAPCPALTLFGPEPDLAGLRLSAPDLAPTDREDLPLLSALLRLPQVRALVPAQRLEKLA